VNMRISPISKFKLKLGLPGDKSISHRALLFGALAEGKSEISNLLMSGDVNATRRCLERLGIRFRDSDHKVVVSGRGLQGPSAPSDDLDCGNSGTTMRLLMGLLAGQNFRSRLTGDESLSHRPMKRVSAPLTEMGAAIKLRDDNYAPVEIEGRNLQGIDYELPVASAQVKGALLLAGLYAEGETILRGQIRSRDHTERLLSHFGAHLRITNDSLGILGHQKLSARRIAVPGDISSAAFWMTAAGITPEARVEFEDVGLNPTRMGFLRVLRRMGTQVEWNLVSDDPEPSGRLWVRYGSLRGIEVAPSEVPFLIDEIPLIAALAVHAEGETRVTGAAELQLKESNRIDAVARGLRAMGAEIEVLPDGFAIEGPQRLRGARIDPQGDHRMAMVFSILGLRAEGETEITDAECVQVSYPSFYEILAELQNG
jgi:3-phosphoshikimate 1-carboxyvinyltransferase